MALPDFANPTTPEASRLGNSDSLRHKALKFAGDSSYPTNGSAGFQTKVRKLLGHDVTVVGLLPNVANGYVLEYDRENDKLIARRSAGSAAALQEVPNATDLSGVTFQVTVLYY
jgi:hypothetical protein